MFLLLSKKKKCFKPYLLAFSLSKNNILNTAVKMICSPAGCTRRDGHTCDFSRVIWRRVMRRRPQLQWALQHLTGKGAEMSTWVSCFYHCRSELEPIHACDCCRVIWPGNECQLSPVSQKTKARCFCPGFAFLCPAWKECKWKVLL